MKPGSSDRCTARTEQVRADKDKPGLRCRGRRGHDGPHHAPRGKTTVRWFVSREQAA